MNSNYSEYITNFKDAKAAKNYGKAIEIIDSALTLYPDNRGLLVDKANLFTELGKYDEAIGLYCRAWGLGLYGKVKEFVSHRIIKCIAQTPAGDCPYADIIKSALTYLLEQEVAMENKELGVAVKYYEKYKDEEFAEIIKAVKRISDKEIEFDSYGKPLLVRYRNGNNYNLLWTDDELGYEFIDVNTYKKAIEARIAVLHEEYDKTVDMDYWLGGRINGLETGSDCSLPLIRKKIEEQLTILNGYNDDKELYKYDIEDSKGIIDGLKEAYNIQKQFPLEHVFVNVLIYFNYPEDTAVPELSVIQNNKIGYGFEIIRDISILNARLTEVDENQAIIVVTPPKAFTVERDGKFTALLFRKHKVITMRLKNLYKKDMLSKEIYSAVIKDFRLGTE